MRRTRRRRKLRMGLRASTRDRNCASSGGSGIPVVGLSLVDRAVPSLPSICGLPGQQGTRILVLERKAADTDRPRWKANVFSGTQKVSAVDRRFYTQTYSYHAHSANERCSACYLRTAIMHVYKHVFRELASCGMQVPRALMHEDGDVATVSHKPLSIKHRYRTRPGLRAVVFVGKCQHLFIKNVLSPRAP